MLRVNLPVLSTIHPQSNKFVTGVRTKAMGDSKLNDNPVIMSSLHTFCCLLSVKKQKHDFHFFFFIQCVIKQYLLDSVFVISNNCSNSDHT